METFLKDFINNNNITEILYEVKLDKHERKEFYTLIESSGLYHKALNRNKTKYIIVTKIKQYDEECECLLSYVNDYNLPIMKLDKKYIEYSLNHLEPYTNYLSIYTNIFKPLVLSLGKNNIKEGLKQYSKCISDVRIYMMDHFGKQQSYVKFRDAEIKIERNKYKNLGRLYKLENSISIDKKDQLDKRKYFVSIDFISANFSNLKYYDKSMVLDADTWQEFAVKCFKNINVHEEKFEDYMKTNKFIRQLILSKLNLKKIMEYSQFNIHKMLNYLLGEKIIVESDIVSVMKDEIIVSSDVDSDKLCEKISDGLQKYDSELHKICRINAFNLYNLSSYDYYVKNIIYDSNKKLVDEIVFKCIDSKYMNQCISFYEGKEITDEDLRFDYDGNCARFDKSIFDL